MKHLTLILILICVLGIPAMAEDDPPPPPPPNEAELFVQEFENFATDSSYGDNTFQKVLDAAHAENSAIPDYNAFKNDLAQMRDGLQIEIDDDYDSNAYFTAVRQKWNQMMNEFGNYPSSGDYLNMKYQYVDQVKEFMRGYLNDMTTEDVGDTIPLTKYIKDYRNLYDDTKNDLETLNEDADDDGDSKSHAFNPKHYLDAGVPQNVRDAVKVELDWGGAYDRYRGYSIKGLLERIHSRFSSSRESIDWFLTAWGPANENVVMEAAQNVNWSGRMTRVNAEYNLNDYGEFITNNEFRDISVNRDDDDDVENNGDIGRYTSSLRESTYNNRSFGFRNGSFTSIKVTIGSRRYRLYDRFYTSPIVLDMDGDGKLQASNGKWLPHPYRGARMTEFDINGDGFLELSEWVGPEDGLLLVYDGGEVNANHLFGEAGGYLHGYEKLSLLDANEDGQLTANELKTLSVWQDRNSNGKVDEGEITSVNDLGITSISLQHDRNLVSSFVMQGENRTMWDWYPVVMFVKRRE
jgi:hypothetical protein